MKTVNKEKKKYVTLEVTVETVKNEWDLPYYGNKAKGVEVVSDKTTDTSRWSVFHDLIVRIGDKYYETSYSVGATECQDELPWQDDSTVDFIEVRQVEKVVKVWEPVEVTE